LGGEVDPEKDGELPSGWLAVQVEHESRRDDGEVGARELLPDIAVMAKPHLDEGSIPP
jgi:hypothetical protein